MTPLLVDVTILTFSTLLNELGFLCPLLLPSNRQAVIICSIKRRKIASFLKKLEDENMIMETLTISRFLEGILCKEFHKVQDVVKKKTIYFKQLKTISCSRHCCIKSKSVMNFLFVYIYIYIYIYIYLLLLLLLIIYFLQHAYLHY